MTMTNVKNQYDIKIEFQLRIISGIAFVIRSKYLKGPQPRDGGMLKRKKENNI